MTSTSNPSTDELTPSMEFTEMKKGHQGPELSKSVCGWLEDGPVLPDTLVVRVSVGLEVAEREYPILDRSSDGRVNEFHGGARRGRKGFVLKVRDPITQQDLAAKLCLAADYEDGHPQYEIDTAAKLRGGERFIHLVNQVGRVAHFESEPGDGDRRDWVCFLSDWLPGKTLQHYIEHEPLTFDASLVAKIAEKLIIAVQFIEARGLKHDDLHPGNIMLVPADADLIDIDPLTPPFEIKIIDLGSAKPKDKATRKRDDDWSSTARCLSALHNVLHSNRLIASKHPAFLRSLAEFTAYLAEEDEARFFPQRNDKLRFLRDAHDSLTFQASTEREFRPFDAISAEHLANDRLLLDLFVRQLPWITMVADPEPSVLVGPRGCGKSMVFRYLAARTHISSAATEHSALSPLKFFGIYIGCSSDITNDLIWLSREPGRPQRLASEIVTYFNLVLARELLKVLASSAAAPSIASALGLTESVRISIVSHIVDATNSSISLLRVGGIDPLQSCAEAIDRIRMAQSRRLLNAESSDFHLGATFIRDLCRLIVTLMPWFSSTRITFLLDDYTSHRLSEEIQTVLNSVLWQRDSSHAFKVSSEPHGFTATHVDGPKIDDNREYVLVDAGDVGYGGDKSTERREFVTELLDKRLRSANYVSDSSTLIGPSKYKDDTDLAKAICGRADSSRIGSKSYYYGLHVLANAWSGDVSTVLHMAREMFASASVSAETTTLISPSTQHQAIVRVSGALRERIAGHHPYGAEMSRILNALGDLAHRLLVASDADDPSGKSVIHRKYRIELSLGHGATIDSELRSLPNGDTLVKIMKEVVRRAVVIELPSSRAKESPGRRTLRWQLRASLLPTFGTSLVRETYIDVKRIEDFAELLTNPEEFAKKAYRRYYTGANLFSDIFQNQDESHT